MSVLDIIMNSSTQQVLHVTRTRLLYDTYELLCKWIIALAEKIVGFFGYSWMEQQRFVLE